MRKAPNSGSPPKVFLWPTLVGFVCYSSPALLGRYPQFESNGFSGEWSGVSSEARWIYGVALSGMVAGSYLWRLFGNHLPPQGVSDLKSGERTDLLCMRLLATNAALQTIFMSVQHGAVGFFLLPREHLTSETSFLSVMWPWSVGLYWLFASFQPFWRHRALATGMLVAEAIAGDRTVPVLAIAAFLTAKLLRSSVMRSASLVTSAALLGMAAIVWKPFYLWVKSGFSQNTLATLSGEKMLVSWEPFLIHENLEIVLSHGFQYPLSDSLYDLATQLLIIPSAFGGDSGRFGEVMHETFFPGTEFGRAYTILGQMFSMGGYLLVFVGTGLVGFLGAVFWRWGSSSASVFSALGYLFAAVVSFYCWRNSIENLAAFMRIILLANSAPLFVIWWANAVQVQRRNRARES